jgi:hypothetical protein
MKRRKKKMAIMENERQAILDNMRELLEKYDYEYTNDALEKIVDTWESNKATLIEAFKKHPKYVDGKFLIAFDADFERGVDRTAIDKFSSWLTCTVFDWSVENSKLPEEIETKRKEEGTSWLPHKIFSGIFLFFECFNGRTLTSEQAQKINEALPNIRAKANEKTSRVINRVCTYLHYNEHPDYNREFAKYADALSPMTIKRHTILSINPIDYLTMSFGNSWASCHTIDKTNRRGIPNSCHGAYSSGTMSYMLDESSMVLYVVDKTYNGTDYFWQDKINRQMFHFGNDKLVQGRLYPQSCDGEDTEYTTYRNTVQEIISTIFDFPNLWTVSKEIGYRVSSYGTHYRDYTHFSYCRISIRKDSKNDEYLRIGHDPICVTCGREHDCEDNISCCYSDMVTCADCGGRYHEDDCEEIDGEWYCHDCCHYCDECGEYTREDGEWIDGNWVCESCLDAYFYQCPRCDEWVRVCNTTWCDEREERYCDECYEQVMEEIEKEREEEEREEEENEEDTEEYLVFPF